MQLTVLAFTGLACTVIVMYYRDSVPSPVQTLASALQASNRALPAAARAASGALLREARGSMESRLRRSDPSHSQPSGPQGSANAAFPRGARAHRDARHRRRARRLPRGPVAAHPHRSPRLVEHAASSQVRAWPPVSRAQRGAADDSRAAGDAATPAPRVP